ncbi:MAG: hypothetical protein K0R83_2890, partial [Caulobacter sp.]|nr:hypothetical protein [Caulobacter sp.]
TLTSASYRDAVHPGHRSTGDGYDLARLNLPDNISAPLAVLGLARDMRPGDQATIGGFPAEAEPFGHYEGSGPIVTTDNALFRHQIDTTIGQSGAPVRVFRNGGWAVIGVHLAEADQAPNGAPTNKALALTPDRLAWLLAG